MINAATQVTATPVPPAPAAAPQAPQAPRTTITVPGPEGTTHRYTVADVDALRARRDELSRQINSAESRRKDVQRSLRGATGADKAGLEQRLAVLDNRIARLEQDIDENSSQLASLDVARATAGTSSPHWGPDTGNRLSANATPLAIVFMLFVMSPLAIGLSRSLWKRAAVPRATAPNPDTTQRLERIEQAIESIAIEVERVSEGQRFVTRLMAEQRPALGVGQPAMDPIPLAENRVPERR